MPDSAPRAAKRSDAHARKDPRAAGRRVVARVRGGHVRPWWLAAAAPVVVALLVFAVVAVMKAVHPQGVPAATRGLNSPPATTAVGRDSTPPWAAPTDAAASVRAAGLPMLREEGTVIHIHAHLDVSVDGQPVVVPAGIGLSSQGISPLHTHNASGVIHIESPVNRAYTLGEFFTEWDVSLSSDNIGGLRAGDGKTLRVFVNGTRVTGNPAAVIFNAHDEIAVIYGNPQSVGSIPSRYDFASGL